MGITIDFLIKHVRPLGWDAARMICQPDGELQRALSALGVPQEDVQTAFAAWTAAALTPLDPDHLQAFVAAAGVASIARIETLRPVGRSTVLFLDAALLRELSWLSTRHRGRAFDFSIHEDLPLVVTRHLDGRIEVRTRVPGVRLAADRDGDCVHLERVH